METSVIAFGSLLFKADPAIPADLELGEAWKRGFLAVAQILENLVDHPVQPVGGLGLAPS